MRHFRLISVILNILIWGLTLSGQETPVSPTSYRVYNQFILNPAIAGSKDYFLIDGISSFQGKYKSQLLTANTRILKSTENFYSAPANSRFTNFGIGGTLFNDVSDSSKSVGASVAAAYHIRLNKQSTSFISFGVAVKGIYNRLYKSAESGTSEGPQETYLPNIDLGAYYYGTRFYAGLSATNILGSDDSLGIPVKPQYFVTAGYKFVISRTLNIVIEPSFIAHAGDSIPEDIKDIVNPIVKIYIENCCFGTYFHNYDNFSFFFQYNFPGISIGTYFEYPKGTAFYKKELNAEFTVGLNLSELRFRNKNPLHW
jgi:type IX secretion system PorP/SprF family membrane protein